MSWQSKETLTIIDQHPIPGLFYLDGDQYSRVLERDATIGLKYPKLGFPSGRAYALVAADDQQLWVHLFADFALPLFADRDTAYNHLKTLTTPTAYLAYFVHPVESDSILIWGKTEPERLLVSYDRLEGRISDIQGVSGTVGAYLIRGQTYHLP